MAILREGTNPIWGAFMLLFLPAALGFEKHPAIMLGALVTVKEGKAGRHVLAALHGGARKLAKGLVQVVTCGSPLGRVRAQAR